MSIGYHCNRCGLEFIAEDSVEREVREMLDSMYDRPPTIERSFEKACPQCDGLDLVVIDWCEICEQSPAIRGGSMCMECEDKAEAAIVSEALQ